MSTATATATTTTTTTTTNDEKEGETGHDDGGDELLCIEKMGDLHINESVPTETQKTKAKNKGTGAGGANTNKNGLKHEEKNSVIKHAQSTRALTMEDIVIRTDMNAKNKRKLCNTPHLCMATFNANVGTFDMIHARKKNLSFMMKRLGPIPDAKRGHGCKDPDEAYIYRNASTRILFIIEKKYQQKKGSVIEKMQGADFKRNNYKKQFPGYQIEYMFVFSEWFREEMDAELEFLNEIQVHVFWDDGPGTMSRVIGHMLDVVACASESTSTLASA
tara:strand:+ start:369 stop:1193 length:825 start_codon:yes stop_codon:yes gene_type:complete